MIFANLADVRAHVVSGALRPAFVAPPKTPADIASKLSTALAETLRLPDVAQRLHDIGLTPVGSSPAEAAAFIKSETERWRNIINLARIKVE